MTLLNSKTLRQLILIAILALGGGGGAVLHTVVGEEHSPGAFLPAAIWRSEVAGGSIYPRNTGSNPLEIFSQPHAVSSFDTPAIGASGGVLSDGKAGAGAVAATYPTLYAILGAGGGFLTDEDGTMIRTDVAGSRPIGNRTVAGVSLTGQYAWGGDRSDLGLGVTLSGAHTLGTLAGLPMFRVHGGIRNAGKTVRRFDNEVPIFPAFTPFIGFDALPIQEKKVSVGVSSTLSLDRFQGLSIDGSGVLAFESGITVSVGWWHRFGGGEDDLWPGISAGVSIPLGGAGGERATRGHVAVHPTQTGVAALSGGVVAFISGIDTVAPETSIATLTSDGSMIEGEGPIVLSPEPSRRQAEFRLSATDDREVAFIQAILLDPQDNIVREWRFVPRYSLLLSGSITDRLTSQLVPTKIDSTVLWDVQDAEADGFYVLVVEAEDAVGNRAVESRKDILVDTTPPELAFVDEAAEKDRYRLGDKEVLSIGFVVRDAQTIEATVVDAVDRVVSRVVPDFDNDANEEGFYHGDLLWAGADDEGRRVDEGVYRIEIVATDAIENHITIESVPIFVERSVPTFTISLTDRIVTPNGDGKRDTIGIRPSVEPIEGLEEWVISLVPDGEDVPIKEWSGIDLPPESIVLGSDVLGVDGTYTIQGESRYQNGSRAETPRQKITVDRVGPTIEIAVSETRVQPEHGRKVDIYLETDGSVAAGRLVAKRRARDEIDPIEIAEFDDIPDRFQWNFTDDNGNVLPPGIYQITFEGEDSSGNRNITSYREVVLQERISGVGIVATNDSFSPNGDGFRDDVSFVVDGPVDRAGVFSVDILNEGGEAIRTIRGEGGFPQTVRWDGRQTDGIPAPDGEYTARVAIEFENAPMSEARSSAIRLDTEAPNATITILKNSIVSPDGDGRKDTLNISVEREGGDPSGTAIESIILISRGEETSIGVNFPERFGSIDWYPRLRDGSVVPDGTYQIVATVTDRVGNDRTVQSGSFTVDTRPVRAFVRVDKGAINTSFEGREHNITFEPILTGNGNVLEWVFTVVGVEDRSVVYRATGEGSTPPNEIIWPGDSESRAVLPDGEYEGRISVVYEHGPEIDRVSPRVRVDSTAPTASVVVDPLPFSPDGDGVADITYFNTVFRDRSDIAYWYLEIIDPRGAFFYDLGGEGVPPERIGWDGRARNGELVLSAETYTWRYEITDVLGNRSVINGELPIDILVEPYQGGYRIQIPSITFEPNSSRLHIDGPGHEAERNRDVLDRISRILRRYPEYSVVVEGHAVNISGTEREEREELIPLSQERAGAVRRALIDRGVPPGMLVAEGRGGTVPLVDHNDLDMRWKNRRVDFILRKRR